MQLIPSAIVASLVITALAVSGTIAYAYIRRGRGPAPRNGFVAVVSIKEQAARATAGSALHRTPTVTRDLYALGNAHMHLSGTTAADGPVTVDGVRSNSNAGPPGYSNHV